MLGIALNDCDMESNEDQLVQLLNSGMADTEYFVFSVCERTL